MPRAYEEIVDFIAAGSTSDDVAAFTASQEARDSVAKLIEREKAGTITSDERADLNHYLEIEHLMRLAKARARQDNS